MSARPRSSTYVLPPDAGRAFWLRGNRFVFKASGDEVGGAFASVETVLHRGAEAPAHRHLEADEALYVVEGELELIVDGTHHTAGAGAFAFLPRGTRHQYLVRGSGTARALWFLTPAGFEQFWMEMGTPVEGSPEPPPPTPPDPARMAELGRKYKTEFFRPGE